MKRQFYISTIVAFVLIIMAIAGCKKYTCECKSYNTTNPESGGRTNYTVKKKDRAKVCTDKSTQPDNFGNYTTCIIK
jgi:hypothetical protein